MRKKKKKKAEEEERRKVVFKSFKLLVSITYYFLYQCELLSTVFSLSLSLSFLFLSNKGFLFQYRVQETCVNRIYFYSLQIDYLQIFAKFILTGFM